MVLTLTRCTPGTAPSMRFNSRMPLSSNIIPLQTPLPEIVLPDLTGTPFDVRTYANGRPLVVVFACNHCPYVQHIEAAVSDVVADYPQVAFVAICSNDPLSHPDDDVPGLLAQTERAGWTFPYLVDVDQRVAHRMQAACTPDIYCFGSDGLLAYRGAFDASRPGQPSPVTGSDLRGALVLVIAGRPVPEPHRPAMGCGIKWKAGNEPG